MRRHGKTLSVLALGCVIAVGAVGLAQQVVAKADEVEAARLDRAILAYIAEKNPQAPIRAFHRFPEVLVAEAERTNIDHCLALAQAEVESDFRHDAVGRAGEIGIFQILPDTAALFEPRLGPFRRPVLSRSRRDLGDLADPLVSTRFAMAYLRDILGRRPNIKDALIEYNGGPAGRHPRYYRTVMGAYVEILERPELKCRYQPVPRRQPVLAALFGGLR